MGGVKIPFLFCFVSIWLSGPAIQAEEIVAERYEKEIVVANCADPLQLEVSADGKVFFIERAGAVKCFDPASGLTSKLLQLVTLVDGDAGALALALDPGFARNGWLYVYYTVGQGPQQMRLARYTWQAGALVDEKRLLEIPLEQQTRPYHCGGGLGWDRQGNLLLSTGDNSAPQDVPAIHPAEPKRDSRRSAGNSKDLRGKILRITPTAEGGYTSPAGNLFADASQGRPEIFAMGVRNPFRVSCDPENGLITWGDVGGNVKVEYGLGPEGSDEINVTSGPGFFGWPWLSGARGVWRPFNPADKQPAGDFFNPEQIVNDSPVNTGLKRLPPALPPVFYYSNTASAEWPFTGSGGRSVTGGVFYRTASTDERRLPDSLRGHLIFGDWMRNWLAEAAISPEGKLVSAGPFLGNLTFKRPADFKIGPEGALYIAEYGEKWTGNTSGQISRVIYRRGNRPPAITLTADRTTGRVPLEVQVQARVWDPDQPSAPLSVRWELPAGWNAPKGERGTITFPASGLWPLTATVTDAAGLSRSATLTIAAGNEAPVARFTSPRTGGFFEYGKPVPWAVTATDAEDGTLPPDKLRVEMTRRDSPPPADPAASPPGLALMRSTTCFACHQAATKSAGPAYTEVARRYASDATAPARLAQKIMSGGAGVWGEMPMPPHPQHTAAECASMVDWILSLASLESTVLPLGLSGSVQVPEPKNEWGRPQNGVLLLTATATDQGAGALPALSSEPATLQLRSRRQRAYFYDTGFQAIRQDNLDEGGMVARVPAGGWMGFRQIDLSACAGLSLEGWPQGSGPLKIEIRQGDGSLLSTLEAAPMKGAGRAATLAFPFQPGPVTNGLSDLSIHVTGPAGALLDVMWVDFLPPAP